MNRAVPALLFLAAVLAAAPSARAQAQAPRDLAKPRAGSARVLGRVIRADTGAPVRRALVLLYGSEIRDGRPVMTDADGNYDSGDLPPGTYHVTVTRQGLLPAEYGAKNPGEPGRAVTIAAGEKLEGVNVLMVRGGSIAGRVLDEYGEPVCGATVQVLRELMVEGMRRLAPAGNTALGRTDDLGQYRVFGLPPGRYFVAASAPSDGGIQAEGPQQGTEQVPAYYPGTANIREAQALEVAAGQDQIGIDLPLTLARTARASGVCLDSQGRPLAGGHVLALQVTGGPQLPGTTRSASVNPDGTFTVQNLPPGDYSLVAVTVAFTGGVQSRGEQGSVRITMASSDVSGITIQTSLGATLSGQIVFEGSSRPPVSPSRVALSTAVADPVDAPPTLSSGGQSDVQEDGRFRFTGLFGQRLLLVSPPDGWMVRAIYYRGRDIADVPFTFDGRETVSGVQVVLTDRVTHVSASVTGPAGDVPQNAVVFVVAEDPARWNGPLLSRYVRHRFCQDGSSAQFDGLPPGDYFAVAVAEVNDPGDLMEAGVLERLRASGQRFSLKEGETKELALKPIKLQ